MSLPLIKPMLFNEHITPYDLFPSFLHPDDEANMPEEPDAERAIKFTRAFAEFLYVLPSKIERGRAKE